MTCESCIRWRRLRKPPKASWRWKTRYGRCFWPGLAPKPLWTELRYPDGEGGMVAPECSPLLPDVYGEGCEAFRERKIR